MTEISLYRGPYLTEVIEMYEAAIDLGFDKDFDTFKRILEEAPHLLPIDPRRFQGSNGGIAYLIRNHV